MLDLELLSAKKDNEMDGEVWGVSDKKERT